MSKLVEQMNQPSGQEFQPLDDKQRDLVALVYNRLETFREGCQELHDRAKESRMIYLLQDPKQDEGNKGKNRKRTIQLQTLKSTIDNSIADQMDNMPEANMLPERIDLQEVADDCTDAVKYVMMANHFEEQHRRLAEDFFVAGTYLMEIGWDEDMNHGKGDIAVFRYPVEAFLWDPQAEDIQDGRACIKVSWHPMSWYHQHYPEQAQYIGNEDHSYSEVGIPDAQENLIGSDEGRAMLIEYWYRLYDAKKHRYTINVAYCAGGALLDVQENVYAHGMYPFVMTPFSRIEGMPAGDSLVQELAPMMRYINRYQRYIDMNLRMSSKGRMLTRRNANIDRKDLIDWDTDVIEGDSVSEEDVRWLQHAPLNGMVVNEMLQLQSDMKQDSGQSQFSRGETTGGVNAASAISMLQEAGSKITRLRTKDLNEAYRKVVEQVIWLMAEFYDNERTAMITGRDGRQRQLNMSASHLFGSKRMKGAVPPPPYSVQIQVNRRNPATVSAQNELFIKAYSMAAEAQQYFPLSVLFELLTVDGKDRILPIIRDSEKQTQQMQQMQAQMEQMAQQSAEQQQAIENLQSVNEKYSQAMLAKGTRPEENGIL